VTDVSEAAREFRDLARNLAVVGLDELKRELYQAISDAADPLAAEIGNVTHLRDYMPNRYAGVLAGSLRVTTSKRTGITDPGVSVVARAPTFGRGGRKIRQRNAGLITHPVFGDRRDWKVQTAGMRPGFFDDPAERAAPHVRDKILEAMRRVEEKALGR
jgi:hypothetical protein